MLYGIVLNEPKKYTTCSCMCTNSPFLNSSSKTQECSELGNATEHMKINLITLLLFQCDKQMVAQHSSREFVRSEIANKNLNWEKTTETFPSKGDVYSRMPLEQFHTAEDRTDYMWYKTR